MALSHEDKKDVAGAMGKALANKVAKVTRDYGNKSRAEIYAKNPKLASALNKRDSDMSKSYRDTHLGGGFKYTRGGGGQNPPSFPDKAERKAKGLGEYRQETAGQTRTVSGGAKPLYGADSRTTYRATMYRSKPKRTEPN